MKKMLLAFSSEIILNSKRVWETAISATKPAESHCGIRAQLIMARVFQELLDSNLSTPSNFYSFSAARMPCLLRQAGRIIP
jgi:hypothetical protein